VTVLSPNTYFNFTPLLASTAVGTLEFRCAVEPVRRYAPQLVRLRVFKLDSHSYKSAFFRRIIKLGVMILVHIYGIESALNQL